MTKKERFPLKMADGVEVRNIDDFKANFDIDLVTQYFFDGRLLTWFEDRYYDEEATEIKKLSSDDELLEQKLCKIFDKETPEEIARRERLNRLKKYTKDENILANVDLVAFDQEELADLLDEDAKEIFLCENRFVIPLRMKNKNYTGVGNAIAVIRSNEPVDFDKLNITFKNVAFDDDYQKILPTPTAKIKSKTKTASAPSNIEVNGNTARVTVKYSKWSKGIVALSDVAVNYRSNITIIVNGKILNAKNFVQAIHLDLKENDLVTIVAVGSDAEKAVRELKKCIEF